MYGFGSWLSLVLLERQTLESGCYFSNLLKAFIPALASANLEGAFEDSGLPPELQRAVIAWRGELTPDYQYIAEHMKANI